MIHILLADGFEEIEALATLDILRRCGLSVETVSINPVRSVRGAHGLTVEADCLLQPEAMVGSEAIVLPGGMPGASNLDENATVCDLLTRQACQNRPIAAICAAPMVPGRLGLLRGRRATCYPGFESRLDGAFCEPVTVVRDGNFITGNGPAAAFEFAFAIASLFVSEEKVCEVKQGMGLA